MLAIIKRDISTSSVMIQGTVKRLWTWCLILEGVDGYVENIGVVISTHEESFQNILRMLLTIKDLNPGIIVTWDHIIVNGNKATLGRDFQAFGASIDVFQYYHPLISIDRTHLYSSYKDKLLIVVVYVASNRVYSLCFVIVE